MRFSAVARRRGGRRSGSWRGLAWWGLILFLAAGCAAGRSGPLSGRARVEDLTVPLLGGGLWLSEALLAESLLALALSDPEARLFHKAESFLAAARGAGLALGPPSARSILRTAFSQVGRPYKFGGVSPQTGFDCSGFVGWVYGQNGVPLPRSSREMFGQGQAVARSELAPGDLVFFGRKKRVTHVGIYTGNNRYIHSPRRGKTIQESGLDDRDRGEYYFGARRLLSGAGQAAIDPAPAAGSLASAE